MIDAIRFNSAKQRAGSTQRFAFLARKTALRVYNLVHIPAGAVNFPNVILYLMQIF